MAVHVSPYKLTEKFNILNPSPSLPLTSLMKVTVVSQADPGTGDSAVLVEDSSDANESLLLEPPPSLDPSPSSLAPPTSFPPTRSPL